MRLPVKAHHLPSRLLLGAFLVNSGVSKRHADARTAEHLHGMATTAYPFLRGTDARRFVRLLSTAEISLGTALLLPVVPTALAGLGLAAFSGGLVGLYLRTPGTRQPGSLRPTEQGLSLAKDSWMLATALGFLLEPGGPRPGGRPAGE